MSSSAFLQSDSSENGANILDILRAVKFGDPYLREIAKSVEVTPFEPIGHMWVLAYTTR